ncbi:hypothetical protein [Gluconobacter oxydans]|uniref:hypothetical protein n=1 Tax=Gluconobacter oxydans TaxID=442 RepID=UPI001CD895D4|nr:hypothetical protein [Gluconobacter oxydans]
MNEEERKLFGKLILDVEFIRARAAVDSMIVQALTHEMPNEFINKITRVLEIGISQTDEEIAGPKAIETPFAAVYPNQWREAAREMISRLDNIISTRS